MSQTNNQSLGKVCNENFMAIVTIVLKGKIQSFSFQAKFLDQESFSFYCIYNIGRVLDLEIIPYVYQLKSELSGSINSQIFYHMR